MVLSVYIPVIQPHITETYIKRQFDAHKIGNVARVDFVKNVNKQRTEAFVHFDEWYDNETSKKLQEDIKNPDTKTRFVYKTNKFFPLLVNKNPNKQNNNPMYEIIKKEDLKKQTKIIISIPSTVSDKMCNISENKRSKSIEN